MHAINTRRRSSRSALEANTGKTFLARAPSAFYPFHASTRFLELPVLVGVCALELGAFLFYASGSGAAFPLEFCGCSSPCSGSECPWMSAYVFGSATSICLGGFCLVAG